MAGREVEAVDRWCIYYQRRADGVAPVAGGIARPYGERVVANGPATYIDGGGKVVAAAILGSRHGRAIALARIGAHEPFTKRNGRGSVAGRGGERYAGRAIGWAGRYRNAGYRGRIRFNYQRNGAERTPVAGNILAMDIDGVAANAQLRNGRKQNIRLNGFTDAVKCAIAGRKEKARTVSTGGADKAFCRHDCRLARRGVDSGGAGAISRLCFGRAHNERHEDRFVQRGRF